MLWYMGPRGRPQLHFAFGLFSGLLSTTTSTSAAMNTSRRCNRRCLCSACDFLACRARDESRACEAVGLGGLVDHLEKTRIDRQIGLGRPPGIEQKGHDREDRAAGERRSDLWIAPQRFLDSHSARPRPELGPRYIRPAGRRSRDELPGFQGAQCRNHAGCQAGVISGVTRARSAPRQSRRTHGMKVTVDGCGRCRVRVTSV
jgi:hypothetical protein